MATKESAKHIEVDPALLAAIGSASVPVRVPPLPKPPSELPGSSSWFKGLRMVLDVMKRGIVASIEIQQKWGDIYTISFVGRPAVVVWDPEEIDRILKNEDRVWSAGMGWETVMFEGLDQRAGNLGSLLSIDFDDHRIARKLVQPAFNLKAIEGYLGIADRWFANTIPGWVARREVVFKSEVRRLLANVANEMFTGLREPQAVAAVDRALVDFWSGLLVLSRRAWLSPTFRRSRRGLRTLLDTFVGLIPERRATPGDDLFSQLCQVTDTDGITDEAMVRIFITIMFGAFDTTSAGMTSMAYLLAKHPAWQERLREEAHAVGANRPDVAAMKSMKQHEWVWKETLRLMPVNGFLPRRALREVTVLGYKLAPGTLVMPMNGGIGRHPKWWTNVDTFDPERFSPDRGEERKHPGIFNPFGGGAHACVGMQLANMEMKLFWHRMLTSCRFRLTEDYTANHTSTPMGMVSGDVALTLEPL